MSDLRADDISAFVGQDALDPQSQLGAGSSQWSESTGSCLDLKAAVACVQWAGSCLTFHFDLLVCGCNKRPEKFTSHE